MYRRHQLPSPGAFEKFAAVDGYAKITAHQRLRSCCAQAHDDIRLDYFDLRLEPRVACIDFSGARFLMNPTLSPLLPLEVFHCVGDVDFGSDDAGLFKRSIEQLAGIAYERLTLEVFVIAWLLADHDDARVFRSFTEHGLCGVLI